MIRFTPPAIDNEILLNFGAEVASNAARLGDKPAVIVSGRTVSWADFGAMVAQVTGKLRAQGIGRGGFVASLAENSLENVVLYCAVLSAGACMVPLPFSATGAALTRMVEDSGASMVFASPTQLEVAQGLGAKQVYPLADLLDWAADAEPAVPAQIAPGDLFNIIYSSGTTGLPKGIIHDHQFRSRQLARITRFGLTEKARMIISTPIYSNTTLFAMLPTLLLGATLIVMPKFNTVEFLTLSQELAPTHATLVPVQYMRLLAEPTFDDYDLSSYEMKFCTSAPLPGSLIAKIMDRWPGNLIEVYGMTEGGISTALNCREFPDKWDTVGRAGEGCDMRVIDEQGKELPAGEFGEIVGRAPSMMPAYHNADEKTRELLWTDAEGRQYIRSGDMGRIDEDGFLHLMDRKKDMIISGGFNIYAADLEAVLRSHPDVTDTAVIAIPSDAWGETPLGFVVLAENAGSTPEGVCAWANEQLGKTQRLSKVIAMDELPRSEIGKILKKDLRAPYWDA
ncbi:class I adenylate-forming enzyme family protein [Pseudooceanicola nitratireducens]|uniref:class I adenylate-forming enzyme family protein n=1 Tax=Pseudooceanicola nitratireducens TaxID=517719 RepID=UPI001C96F9F9|nr:class I adenylate-forming enzyme family protein [Pseudooceanicola nitratireducens]MBY6159133.1 acyl--CoA ligase [Pseudooceanicola nitratireducens]